MHVPRDYGRPRQEASRAGQLHRRRYRQDVVMGFTSRDGAGRS
jgi:hypothetical protein